MSTKLERRLRVEAHLDSGDSYRAPTASKIRLKGKWLALAGFTAGQIVTVKLGRPGTLLLEVGV